MLPQIFTAPGWKFNERTIYQMVNFGAQIRDQYLSQWPHLPGAVKVFGEIAASREWKLSGSARGTQRALEYLYQTQTLCHNGIFEYGMEQFIKRKFMDYLCIGRTMFYWDEGQPIRYLDPKDMTLDWEKRQWMESYFQEYFPIGRVVITHPMPIGSEGYFSAPLATAIRAAILAWLIREHDTASADGRKVRDIFFVKGDGLAKEIKESIEEVVTLWTGKGDPTKTGVNIIDVDPMMQGPVGDAVYRLGLANIPENFNREKFTLEYVNEIASATGLALRHFFNGPENSSNRALEEVQEARQINKGPAAFIRSMQREINENRVLKQFGPSIRFAFIEEVDVQSMKANSEALKNRADSVASFVQSFGGRVNIDQLIAWVQADGLLPADLEIINSTLEGALVGSDDMPLPTGDNEIVDSDPQPNAIKAFYKDIDLDEDEVTIDSTGKIIDYRRFTVSMDRIMTKALQNNSVIQEEIKAASEKPTIESLLTKAREKTVKTFKAKKAWPEELAEEVSVLKTVRVEDWTDREYQAAKLLLERVV